MTAVMAALAGLGAQVVEGSVEPPDGAVTPRYVWWPAVSLPAGRRLTGEAGRYEATGQLVCVADTARGARYWADRAVRALDPGVGRVLGGGVALEDTTDPAAPEWSITLDILTTTGRT